MFDPDQISRVLVDRMDRSIYVSENAMCDQDEIAAPHKAAQPLAQFIVFWGDLKSSLGGSEHTLLETAEQGEGVAKKT